MPCNPGNEWNFQVDHLAKNSFSHSPSQLLKSIKINNEDECLLWPAEEIDVAVVENNLMITKSITEHCEIKTYQSECLLSFKLSNL